MSRNGDNRIRWKRRGVRSAFSLAEMMIALIILGFGLLIVGAALPIGLTYTRDSIDMATGEAAAQYGLDEVERCVRLSQTAYRDNLFRPRSINDGKLWATYPQWEPLIKVRPVVAANIAYVGGGAAVRESGDPVEGMIADWLGAVHAVGRGTWMEVDFSAGVDHLPTPAGGDNILESMLNNPCLSAIARVYPPVSSDTRFTATNAPPPAGFFSNMYSRSDIIDSSTNGELTKALDRRVFWTAFYRRLAYDQPGPNDIFGAGAPDIDDIVGDPFLYEIVVLAVRRPTVAHRFAVPVPSTGALAGGDGDPFYGGISGEEPDGEQQSLPATYVTHLQSVTPMPWLVVFTALPPLPTYDIDAAKRQRTVTGIEPSTLTFRCQPSAPLPPGSAPYQAYSGQFPVGTVFIPAVNDIAPTLPIYGPLPHAGFVPHAPTTLPIYEVVERPDNTTIVVKNNGYYPWVDPDAPTNGDPNYWPVWVIPPSYIERDQNGSPLHEDRSPILAVSQRYVRLREIP